MLLAALSRVLQGPAAAAAAAAGRTVSAAGTRGSGGSGRGVCGAAGRLALKPAGRTRGDTGAHAGPSAFAVFSHTRAYMYMYVFIFGWRQGLGPFPLRSQSAAGARRSCFAFLSSDSGRLPSRFASFVPKV